MLVGLGLLLRVPTLDAQSFWIDEAFTVDLLRGGLAELGNTESTPPLYYALAWVWSQVAGDGEFGLRMLSALLGAATVPAVFAAGAALGSRRVGLAAAALATVNPLLVWYSQEARAYALLLVLGTLSFAFFARALHEPRTRVLAGWAAASALALLTHYFAVFLVFPEAVWLLARHRRMGVVGAIAVPRSSVLPGAGVLTDELVVIGRASVRPEPPPSLPGGLRLVERRDVRNLEVASYRAPAPVRLTPAWVPGPSRALLQLPR